MEKSIDDLIAKSPRLKSSDAQMVLRDGYETSYEIYNHADPKGEHPLALVMMNWNEDPITGGALHERMTQYIDLDIQKYFGISFLEFVDQPTYVVRMQIEMASEKIRKEAPAVAAAAQALRDLKQDKKG